MFQLEIVNDILIPMGNIFLLRNMQYVSSRYNLIYMWNTIFAKIVLTMSGVNVS